MGRTKVRFTRDYRGWATEEVFYAKGAVAKVAAETADYLESVNAAERVKAEPEEEAEDAA